MVSQTLLFSRSLEATLLHEKLQTVQLTYLAFAVDNVCLLLLQLIAVSASRNTHPEVDFQSPISPAQLASEYLLTSHVVSLL